MRGRRGLFALAVLVPVLTSGYGPLERSEALPPASPLDKLQEHRDRFSP